MSKSCCRIALPLLTIMAICLLAGCGGSGPAVSPAVQGNSASAVTTQATGDQRVIITYRSAPGTAQEDTITRLGGRLHQRHHITPTIAATVSAQSIAQLKADPQVQSVEPDAVVKACAETIPWGVAAVQAPQVQAAGNTGAGVKIAIIDSGIDYTHPDLAPNYKGGYDFQNSDADPMDDYGHGTHCAGDAAAANNGSGITGVAPGASIYALKVLNASGIGYNSTIIAALQWCVDNHIQVASMSLAGTVDSAALHSACDAASSAGVTLVAAAGNFGAGADTVGYPAHYSSVIAVGAVGTTNTIMSFSSTGPSLALVAPGDQIYTTAMGGGYAYAAGTSEACPHVAGVAALVIKAGFIGPANVRSQLIGTALHLGTSGCNPQYGYGLVQALAATGGTALPPAGAPPASPPAVSSITANCGLNTGSVSITNLAGSGFVQGATVKLNKTGQSAVTATGVTVVSATQITGTLNLTGALAGSWDVVVTNPDGQSGTLASGFAVSNPPPTVVHDVAVTKIGFAGRLKVGSTIALSVTVVNQGAATETTTLTVTDKTTSTVIGSATVTLAAGANTTVPLSWVPTLKGTNALAATASKVAGETDLSDNTRNNSFAIN